MKHLISSLREMPRHGTWSGGREIRQQDNEAMKVDVIFTFKQNNESGHYFYIQTKQ